MRLLLFASARDACDGQSVVEIPATSLPSAADSASPKDSPKESQTECTAAAYMATPRPTITAILDRVHARYPALSAITSRAMLTVNLEAVPAADWDMYTLSDADELAIVPPVSGG